MKLDPDAVRNLLLEIERDHQGPNWELWIEDSDFPRFYTAKKLLEGGYINGEFEPTIGGTDAIGILELSLRSAMGAAVEQLNWRQVVFKGEQVESVQ